MVSFISDFIPKLTLLTEEFIEVTGDMTSRGVRDKLIAELFPLLTKEEQTKLADQTEYTQVERFIKANYGEDTPADVLEYLTRKWIRSMRIDEAEAKKLNQSNLDEPKRAP